VQKAKEAVQPSEDKIRSSSPVAGELLS
jgi:hypothetical protein